MFDRAPSQENRPQNSRQPRFDPILSPIDALMVIMSAMRQPMEFETIVLPRHADLRRQPVMMTISGTEDPDTILGIVDTMADTITDTMADPLIVIGPGGGGRPGLIIATVRPQGGVDVNDLARWHAADERCAADSIDLIEWFVIGSGVECPRTLCGVPSRWAV